MWNTGSSTTCFAVPCAQTASCIVISSWTSWSILTCTLKVIRRRRRRNASAILDQIGTVCSKRVQRRKASSHFPVAKQSCTQQLEQHPTSRKSAAHFRKFDRPFFVAAFDAHIVGYFVAGIFQKNGWCECWTPGELVGDCDVQQSSYSGCGTDKQELLGEARQMDFSGAGWTVDHHFGPSAHRGRKLGEFEKSRIS